MHRVESGAELFAAATGCGGFPAGVFTVSADVSAALWVSSLYGNGGDMAEAEGAGVYVSGAQGPGGDSFAAVYATGCDSSHFCFEKVSIDGGQFNEYIRQRAFFLGGRAHGMCTDLVPFIFFAGFS